MVDAEVRVGFGPIVTVAIPEYISEQTPLLTTALNWVVAVNGPEV